MCDTEETKLFMRTKARQMLKAANIPLGPEPAKSWTPSTMSPAAAMDAATGPAEYEIADEEDDHDDSVRPPPPPPAAPVHMVPFPAPAAGPLVECVEAAVIPPVQPPTRPEAATPAQVPAAADGAPSPRPRTGVPRVLSLLRAAKAQVTKAAAVAKLKNKSLGTTLPLNESDLSSQLNSPSGRARTPRLSDQSSS